jgi:hypothetical protein
MLGNVCHPAARFDEAYYHVVAVKVIGRFTRLNRIERAKGGPSLAILLPRRPPGRTAAQARAYYYQHRARILAQQKVYKARRREARQQ